MSEVYFERCHSADIDRRRSSNQRKECWARWLRHYSSDQSPERIYHARSRLAALSGGPLPPLPPEPETHLEMGGGSQGPAPLSTPTPQTAAVPKTPAIERVSAEGCGPVCDPIWNACASRCQENARRCLQACENEYRFCIRGCY